MKSPEIIVAIGLDGAIGCENRLIWPISEDLRHFKAVTTGHPVIMGRNTWESLPKKPLPGRTNIVVTSRPGYQAHGALCASSLQEALRLASEASEESPFVIGGGRLYAESLPLCRRLHMTLVEAEAPHADTWFPTIDPSEWDVAEESEVKEADCDGKILNFRFRTLVRK